MMSNFVDWENIIHFGNFFGSIWKKNILFALGTTPLKGKITGFKHNGLSKIVLKRRTCTYLIQPTTFVVQYRFTSGEIYR